MDVSRPQKWWDLDEKLGGVTMEWRVNLSAGPQSCLLCATFPKDGLGLVVANPCSDLQTSPLLNSTDPPSFLTVRQFRVPY